MTYLVYHGKRKLEPAKGGGLKKIDRRAGGDGLGRVNF